MIYNSEDWKKELKKINKRLKTSKYRKFFTIEKDIFISAFIVRKLIESDKMTDRIDNYMLDTVAYKPIKEINRIHCYIEEKEYNWKEKTKIRLEAKKICNFLIHSYVFNLVFAERERKVEKFLVSSDYDRNKYLYEVNLKEWIKFLEEVINDDIIELHRHYEKNKKDYISTKK